VAGKKANGEGAIAQLENGRWRVRVMIDGKRHSANTATRKEAQAKYREFHGNADKGLLPASEKLTLSQHIERWLSDVVQPSVRSRTHKGYSDVARRLILPTLGKMKLTQIQPNHVQQLYGQLTASGLAPQSVRNVHAVLRRALGQAVDWNLVPRNVAALAKPPRVARREVEVLSPDEVRTLIAAVRGDRWEALIATALATGMRQGELLGLKWADVDLTRRVLHVQRQLQRDGTFEEPKTTKGRRTIDLPASCVAILKEHRRQQTEERLLVGPEWQHDDLIFCTHQGKPLSQRNVLRAYKLVLSRASLPDVSFHALRHTAATLLLLQGVHPKVVQERLGHSNISMTLDIYSHLIPSMGRAAADQLDALLA